MHDYCEDLKLAHLLADSADAISQNRFRAQDLVIATKADHTEVSDADRAIEAKIRSLLAEARPNDAIHGEEMADSGSGSRTWIIDPIDGTANYVRAVPVWASLIALTVDGQVRLGMVSAPSLGRRWWACEGAGAFTSFAGKQARQIHVSKISNISDAFISYSSLHGWISCGRAKGFNKLLSDAARTRAFGDFWSYMMVAEGSVDAAAEPELALHDMAALDIIVREAGGRFTNLDGSDGPWGPGAIASNGLLHQQLVSQLSPELAD